jgi:hypothetical protein
MWGFARPEAGPVTVKYHGQELQSVVDAKTMRWDVTLPATDATMKPSRIQITSGRATLSLIDILVGDVYICVGASNVDFKLVDAVNGEFEVNATSNYSHQLRILHVDHASETTPQDDFPAKTPWQPVMPNDAMQDFSAICYFFGLEQLRVRPDVPVGLIAASWGATSALQWSPPGALDECGLPRNERRGHGPFWEPQATSVLWYSMIQPLTVLAIRGFIINLQGANSDCILPSMVRSWQWFWTNRGFEAPAALAAQFGCNTGPSGESESITEARFKQMSFLEADRTGLAVTSDLCDPASPQAIMHSPFKREEAQRLAILGESIIHGNSSIPARFPQPVAVHAVMYDPSWGAQYHYGTGIAHTSGGAGGGACVWGIQVEFDQDVQLRPEFKNFKKYMAHINGFELRPWKPTGPSHQITMSLTRVSGNIVTLNATVKGADFQGDHPFPATLSYGLGSFPVLPLVNKMGMPVGQFERTVEDV